jgi:hypothetical protein
MTKSAEPKTTKKSPAKKKEPSKKELLAERGKPGPKPKPKGELARNCVAIHLTDAEAKALKGDAKKNEAKVGATARDIVVKSLKARKLL